MCVQGGETKSKCIGEMCRGEGGTKSKCVGGGMAQTLGVCMRVCVQGGETKCVQGGVQGRGTKSVLGWVCKTLGLWGRGGKKCVGWAGCQTLGLCVCVQGGGKGVYREVCNKVCAGVDVQDTWVVFGGKCVLGGARHFGCVCACTRTCREGGKVCWGCLQEGRGTKSVWWDGVGVPDTCGGVHVCTGWGN